MIAPDKNGERRVFCDDGCKTCFHLFSASGDPLQADDVLVELRPL